ncbi:MAG: class I SAM-dependent RNA methyltransferase [Deinococcus-Thermus bacterium]|uniref:class I SAM-dependent RNA methyltransferase n=1 Tax=Meiothermus luteus TaxID=2026184 RepID=UPI000E65D7E2|nr:class I SAM-dependent RNA methyltransferase [Meiothermus luteus]RMH54849.1 MAG: class I SAM-dependent RNA methyltransferase [Deinococcota bacterium]
MTRLRIEKLVPGGLGLARTPEGVALVRGGLPGELVEAELRPRKNHLEGWVKRLLEAHPERYPKPLPPSADLPLAYRAQLPLKQGLVREVLARIARVDLEPHPIAPSPSYGPEPGLHYRTAAQYALHPLGGLAYRYPGTYDLLRLDGDPLIAKPMEAVFSLLSGWPLGGLEEVALRASLYEGRVLVAFIGGAPGLLKRSARALLQEGVAGVVWAEASPKGRFRGLVRPLGGELSLLEKFGDVLATISVQSFAQVNPKAAGSLYQEAAHLAGSGRKAVELYAGSGVLSLHLAPRFEEVVAVEISHDAVKRGEADRRRMGVENLVFHRDDARVLPQLLPAELVAVNPPRAGLSAEVVRALLEGRPPRILYIACDPATWARDVGRLVRGGYRLVFARPYDFYPFTHHVEVLSLLVLGP